MLHKYANEDVSLGSWFIGLDVEQVDDKKLCCSTPPGKFSAFIHFWACIVFAAQNELLFQIKTTQFYKPNGSVNDLFV